MQYPWVVYSISEFGHCMRITGKTNDVIALVEADDYNRCMAEQAFLAIQSTAIAVPLPWTGE
jgi:hypothetical protein